MLEFKFLDTTIQIKFLFIAIITIFLLTDTTGLSIICLLSCVFHELGHLLSFRLVQIKPKLLCFDITGIKLEQPTTQLPFLTELIILLAGSFTNYTMAFIGYLISPIQNQNLIIINIIIGTFNLLPLSGFDGGKIVFTLLSIFLTDKTAYKISTWLDSITKIILISLCLFSIYAYQFNLSYIIITILLIVSLFMNKNN